MTASGAACALVALAISGGVAAADSYHGGLAMRADDGARHVRATAGLRLGAADLNLVLDPVGLFARRADTDVTAAWWFARSRFAAFLGHRTTIVEIREGRQFQQKLLIGFEAALPSVGVSWLRAAVGLELAATWVRHGDELPTGWVSFSDSREFSDLWNVNMLARVELAPAEAF